MARAGHDGGRQPGETAREGRTCARQRLFRDGQRSTKANLWAVTNSTRDLPFFVSLKGQAVTVTARRGTSAETFTGVLGAVVYQGGDQNAGVIGVVIEEPVQTDGTTQAHYIPIDALVHVSFRVVKRQA